MSWSPGQNNRRPVAIILEDRPRRRIVYKKGTAKGKNMVKCERGKVVSKKAAAFHKRALRVRRVLRQHPQCHRVRVHLLLRALLRDHPRG